MASGRQRKVHSLLVCVQDAVKRRMTNPYQIAKATGLPLRSVQKLLAQTNNPTLKNIDVILNGLGITLYEEELPGESLIKQGRRSMNRKPKTGKDGAGST